jgi:hypothetical protein
LEQIVARYVFKLEDTRRGGVAAGRITFKRKTGIHSLSITPEQRRENSSRGGITQGNIQGKRNVDSGQMDRMRQLPQTKAAQSLVGKKFGRALGLKYGKLQDMSAIKTPESCKLGQANGGDKSRHVRWHTNREIKKFKCTLCLAEMQKKEGLEIVVQEPGFEN